MQALARNGYTREQVIVALHASNRQVAFRYDLLTYQNRLKGRLDNVLAASVEYHSLAEIKRTARFTLRDTGQIDFLKDRIKPWVRLGMPDGGWVEWPQGVFVLSTPPRQADAAGVITRQVTAYDLLQVLTDDKISERYTISAGANYIGAVKGVLDSAGFIRSQNLTPTSKTLPTDRDWPPGTKKLEIINDLLGAINYRSLYIDENGIAVAEPYISPADRASEYPYRNDDKSVIFPGVSEQLDLFAVPNKWFLVVSEPDREPLIATYTNTKSESPTSTVNRGRTIVDYQEQMEVADQDTLDAKVTRLAFEASQVYQQVKFKTAIMPMHSDSDVLTLEYTDLGISAKYAEVAWGYDLKAGAQMWHQVRRVVNV